MSLLNSFIKVSIKEKKSYMNFAVTYFIMIGLSFVFYELAGNQLLKNNLFAEKVLFTPVSLFISFNDIISFIVVFLSGIMLIQIYMEYLEKSFDKLAVYKISGCSSLKLTFLYMSSCIILCLLITPFSLILGYGMTIIVHAFLFPILNINSSIFFIAEDVILSIISTVIMLIIIIIIYTTGFFYRYTFLEILQNLKERKSEKKVLFMISPKIYIILLIISFLMLIDYTGNVIQLPTIGLIVCVSLYGIDRYWYNMFVDKVISNDSAIGLLAKGQIKKFIGDSYFIMFLLQITIIAFSVLIVSCEALQSDLFITLLAFTVSMSALLSTFQYKLNLFIHNNKRVYNYAKLLGFSKNDIQTTLSKIFKTMIAFILFIPLVFQCMSMIKQVLICNYPLWIVLYIICVEIIVLTMIYLKTRKILNMNEENEYE